MPYLLFYFFSSRLSSHSVSLFTGQECPKISLTSNPRQNCWIGQPSKKSVFFCRISSDPGENAWGSRGRSGASWRHLEVPYRHQKNFTYTKSFVKFNRRISFPAPSLWMCSESIEMAVQFKDCT